MTACVTLGIPACTDEIPLRRDGNGKRGPTRDGSPLEVFAVGLHNTIRTSHVIAKTLPVNLR